jgi:aldose 1-epimerase
MDVDEGRSGTQWSIEADGHRAVVVEVGGGLRTYTVNGQDIVDGYGPDEVAPANAGQVLAPWPNRIRDGQFAFGGEEHQLALTEPERHAAIHGLVNWVRWRLLERSTDAVELGFDLPAQPGYPWALRLRSRWSVSANGLRGDHEVVNTDETACPFGFSVHPYLMVPGVAVDDLLIRIPARRRVLSDSRLLPIGAVPVAGTDFDYTEPRRIGEAVLDTTFGDVEHGPDGSWVTLAGPGGTPEIRLWADAGFRWWQVYTGDTLGEPRYRRSVAVEPMTCPPDAFRSGRDVVVLEPGRSWRGSWGIRTALG